MQAAMIDDTRITICLNGNILRYHFRQFRIKDGGNGFYQVISGIKTGNRFDLPAA
jgi:hypothetical protein